MRPNVKAFVGLVAEVHQRGPVVEYGSRREMYQSDMDDMRLLFPGKDYVGCDARDGPGVDKVDDLVQPAAFQDESIGTLLVIDLLVHIERPWLAVENARRLLRQDGLLVVTTMFSFPIHRLPDYWRFSPEGMSQLLKCFEQQLVFHQGPLEAPHTIYAVAARTVEAMVPVWEHLFKNLQRIPGLIKGEGIYWWQGAGSYTATRVDANQEAEIAKKYGFHYVGG